MELENFKVWQWMLIGLLVGLGIGYWKAENGPDIDDNVVRTVYQPEFEERLFDTYVLDGQKPENARPVFTSVTIHPPIDGKVWVTGLVMQRPSAARIADMVAAKQPVKAKFVGFRYPTEVPYRPQFYANLMPSETKPATNAAKPESAFAAMRPPANSVVQYLDRLKAERKDFRVSYRYAWWEAKPATVAIWTAGSFTVIGVVWPIIVRLLMGVGLARRPVKKEYDLNRFKAQSKTGAPSVNNFDTENKQLDDLNASLEAKLAGFVDEDAETKAENAAVEAKVRALPTSRLEPLAGDEGDRSDANREYTGEFYPVVKTHGDQAKK